MVAVRGSGVPGARGGSGVAGAVSAPPDGIDDTILALAPEGYWKLDDASSPFAAYGSTALTGSAGAGVTPRGASAPDGRSYASFNNGRVTVVDNDAWSIALSSGGTVGAFVKRSTGVSDINFAVAKGNTSQYEWQLAASGKLTLFQNGGIEFSRETPDSDPGADASWHLVVAVIPAPVSVANRGVPNLVYVDGTQVATTHLNGTSSSAPSNQGAALTFGERADGSGTFVGALAHVFVFPGRQLTGSEIAGIAAAGVNDGLLT